MSDYPEVPCKGCGRPIVWAKSGDGRAIPLDPRPPVYDVAGVSDGVICTRNKGAMVSHFATCPKAKEFSGRSRR